jgi:hypothetical protein
LFGELRLSTSKNMMKALAILLLACQASALGQGRIYSFSGQVTDVSHDAAGSISARGIAVGDPLTASFVVDVGRPGIYTQNDGAVVTKFPYPYDTIQYRYYYDRLLSELPIQMKDGGSRNSSTDIASLNYAYDNFGIAQVFISMGFLQGGSENEYVTISKSDPLDATISTWNVGDSFALDAWAYDAQNRLSVLNGTVTLVSIDPVPEPSTCMLFALGLALLVRTARQR